MSAPQQRADIAGHGAEPSLRLSLPRSARLCESSAYERVFAAPSRSTDHYFTVLGRERSSLPRVPTDGARLGLAISKRCAQRAVVRNRIKRVVRESFRLTRERLPAIDLVVLCRHAAAKADTATLRASLATHWMRFYP